jgi:hypothetical protein
MTFSTLIFGDELYRVDHPERTWQQTPDGDTFCIECGESLTFTFPALTDPQASSGGAYMSPVGVRCKCFLDDYQKLKRPPIPITLKPKKEEEDNLDEGAD